MATHTPLTLLLIWLMLPVLSAQEAPSGCATLQLLGPNINTDYPDLAPVKYADKLYFTTIYNDANNYRQVNRVWTVLPSENANLFSESPENDRVHMAQPALTVAGDRIYYTLFRETPDGDSGRYDIWYRDRTYSGEWGPPIRLPRHLGGPRVNLYMPATGIFRETRQEVLFFVSDRPGGKGKLDIWYTEVKKDGTFGEPINFSLNTKEDDITPFFNVKTQSLFFSSKGHAGHGGFDVFRSKRKPGQQWSDPVNLERPVNSFYDDTFFTFHEGSERGYFSSDRPNETCPPDQPGCRDFDIYEVRFHIDFRLFIYNADNDLPLAGCNVEIQDAGTEEILHTFLQLEGNNQFIGLEKDRRYRVIVSRPGYFPVFRDLPAPFNDRFEPVKESVFLKPMNKGADSK